jgi:hypothetical protein
VGYKFTLVLSREITDDESVILKEAGCTSAVFGTDSLPTNADTVVTKMDFDDTISPTLAEAIESALEAVKKVSDLSVPGLTVPAQPAGPVDEEPKVVAGEVVEEAATEEAATEEAAAEVIAEEPPAEVTPKRTGTRKAATRKKVKVSAEAG